MASLDDILTTQKNGVVAVNSLNQTTINQIGSVTSLSVSTPTVIFSGSGRLVNFCVVAGGTTVGGIYNTTDTTGLSPATPVESQLCAVPTTAGIYPAGLVFNSGLTVYPGTGQYINVTYSIG